ncbi:hypothetical protein [Nannocystis pusilla]|uniref:hypothetical protein n=1 Tax=Nannocystis pusilla TaxID=889268 RepID=UPI003B799395
MKPLPTSEWSSRDVPPASSTSQKLISDPRVPKHSTIVCLSPTAWAVLASSSSSVPSRRCAADPAEAPRSSTAPDA